MWRTCHIWVSAGGGCSPPTWSLSCPACGGAWSVLGVRCGLLPSLDRLPPGMQYHVPHRGNDTRYVPAYYRGWGGGGGVLQHPPGPPHDFLVGGTKVTPPLGLCCSWGSGIFGGAGTGIKVPHLSSKVCRHPPSGTQALEMDGMPR